MNWRVAISSLLVRKINSSERIICVQKVNAIMSLPLRITKKTFRK